MKFLSDKKNLYFIGVYLSFFAFILSSAADWNLGIALFKILAILLLGIFLFRGNSTNSMVHTIDFEKSVIVLIVLLFNIFMLQRGKMQGYYELLNIMCSCVLIVMGIAYYACDCFAGCYKESGIKKWFTQNKIVLFVILCFVLLSIEVITVWLIWDSWQYYASLFGIMSNLNADFSGIYGLYLCGHASLGYSLWIIFSQLIYEGAASAQIADIILAGISIFAYYQILRRLLGRKYPDRILALPTALYAFSPSVLGLVGNINLDSATLYFAVIFIACSLYHYRCLELVFGFCFCFTKESAIFYYVAYIVAKVICDYFSENRFHLWKLIKFGFGNIRNYVYALPAILWMVLYKLNLGSGWNGENASAWSNEGWNCFGINTHAISIKLKQIGILNFNWLFLISIILGIIILCIKKVKIEKKMYKSLLPICVMGVSVIVFGCIFITYSLPRYIIPIIPAIYLAATVVIGNLKNKFFYVWNILVSILLLIQCFKTIDPVMLTIFPTVQMGSHKYDVFSEPDNNTLLSDQITYNRQNIYWAEAFTKLLDDAGYDGTMLIVYPDYINNARYELLGNGGCLWNTQKGKLEYYNSTITFPEECVWVNSCYVSQAEGCWEAGNYGSILYMIPAWANIDENLASENERFSKEVVKQGEINNKGINIRYLIINMKYKAPLGNGNFTISPKQENSLGLGTNGEWIWLKEGGDKLGVTLEKTRYQFMFNDYHAVMDVRYNYVDSNGTVWVYEENGTDAQKWSLEKVDEYYMICWGGYALTYDLNNYSVKLTEKTGSDNQLWSFVR